MNFLYEDAEDIMIDGEAEEVEDAMQDVISNESNDIDAIANITDEDVDEFEDEEDDGFEDDSDYIEYLYDDDEDLF